MPLTTGSASCFESKQKRENRATLHKLRLFYLQNKEWRRGGKNLQKLPWILEKLEPPQNHQKEWRHKIPKLKEYGENNQNYASDKSR